MTVEAPHVGSRTKLETVGLPILLVGVVGTFFAGGLLGEDSTGGLRFDFYVSHWPTIQRFSTMPWSKAVVDYYNPENPLLYMIASLLPLDNDPKRYHVITFVAALLTWPLLSWAYYRRYSKCGIDWLWSAFGASAILLSPCFRSSAFWGDTDWLPFAFCAGTSLLLSRFQDSEGEKTRRVGPVTLISLAVISAAAFYTRQYYAFLPAMAAWVILTRTQTTILAVLSVFLAVALPELYLIFIWKGLVPPFHQGQNFHPALLNVWEVGTAIALFSSPVFVGCIRRSLGDVLPEWWGLRSTVLAVAGLLVFIAAIMALGAPDWVDNGLAGHKGQGGGIIVKAGLRMGALGTPFILVVSYFGLVAALLFSMRSTTNAVLAGSYLAPLFLTVMYQRYVEPSFIVALFIFADTQTAKAIFNKRVLICNFVFTLLVLVVAIVYYDLLGHADKLPIAPRSGA